MDGHIQGINAELGFQCVRDTPRQHLACMPVHDRGQIEKASAHWQTSDVSTPGLIGPIDA